MYGDFTGKLRADRLDTPNATEKALEVPEGFGHRIVSLLLTVGEHRQHEEPIQEARVRLTIQAENDLGDEHEIVLEGEEAALKFLRAFKSLEISLGRSVP